MCRSRWFPRNCRSSCTRAQLAILFRASLVARLHYRNTRKTQVEVLESERTGAVGRIGGQVRGSWNSPQGAAARVAQVFYRSCSGIDRANRDRSEASPSRGLGVADAGWTSVAQLQKEGVKSAVMQFFLGILAAVVIFVFTEWLGKMVFEPVVALRRAVGKTDSALVMYANVYSNPGIGTAEEHQRAYEATRGASSELQAAARSVVWYGMFARLHLVPDRNRIREACRLLIGVANGLTIKEMALANYEAVEKIRNLLGIAETSNAKKRHEPTGHPK